MLAGHRWRREGQTGPGTPWGRQMEENNQKPDEAPLCHQTSFSKYKFCSRITKNVTWQMQSRVPFGMYWHMYSVITVLKGCELPGGQGISHIGIDGGNSVEGGGDMEPYKLSLGWESLP